MQQNMLVVFSRDAHITLDVQLFRVVPAVFRNFERKRLLTYNVERGTLTTDTGTAQGVSAEYCIDNRINRRIPERETGEPRSFGAYRALRIGNSSARARQLTP